MANGKFLGFLGKVGNLIGNVIPGAGVAGKLATNASNMVKAKLNPSPAQKAANAKQVDKESDVAALMLAGKSEFGAKLSVFLKTVWEFIVKYWYVFLPGVIILLYLLIFRRKKTYRKTRRSGSRYIPVTRKRTSKPKGSAWARKMLLARRRKARLMKR